MSFYNELADKVRKANSNEGRDFTKCFHAAECIKQSLTELLPFPESSVGYYGGQYPITRRNEFYEIGRFDERGRIVANISFQITIGGDYVLIGQELWFTPSQFGVQVRYGNEVFDLNINDKETTAFFATDGKRNAFVQKVKDSLTATLDVPKHKWPEGEHFRYIEEKRD